MNRKTILVIVVAVLVGLVVVGASAFIIWADDASEPMPIALAAMQSDEFVEFSNSNGWLVFQPTAHSDPLNPPPSTGFILYPGGRVDYRAYAPIAREIAAQGYLVVVPPVPLNLAFFGANVAEPIMAAFPQVEHWAVGGHSLGGVAASSFADANRDQIGGIAFWASYPAGDMSTFSAISIYGTNDGLAPPAEIEESKKNLPLSTVYVPIEGGNHGQFGAYGPQSGDKAGTISGSDQQRQVADATAAMLSRLK